MDGRTLMLGNDAIARALLEQGCAVATSYPGTPASEILAAVARLGREHRLALHAEWAVNEKVAFEIAYTASMTGLRAAVSMKQVGLNVASDPLMSAAYMGVAGGFLVISADDPGPHSSQTEQDSRLMAMAARVPVLDPDSPRRAAELVASGYALSEELRIPVMLRPTTRVCHASQDILPGPVPRSARAAGFRKDPARWAATPKFRHRLHEELARKLAAAAAWPGTAPLRLDGGKNTRRAVVASGVAAAHAREVMEDAGLLGRIALYQVLQPYPLHAGFIERVLATHREILVLEETAPVIEMQLADRHRVRGRLAGTVPEAGELLPEVVLGLVERFAGRAPTVVPAVPAGEGRRPTLCPGCPHRSSFFAIKKAAPKGIYPSDIGCYTLGLNLGAVDSFVCMGAAVSQAAGFYHAYRLAGKTVDIVATIGDSTFYHAGIPALLDAVVQGARFVLVILDNATTAMTGNQPTPATGVGASGEPTAVVELETVVRGCGVSFCRVAPPDPIPAFVALLEEALAWSRAHGPAVVIARSPCVVDRRQTANLPPRRPVRIDDACTGCRYCTAQFECPALVYDEEGKRVRIDEVLCTGCAACIHACPTGAIREEPGEGAAP